ncbi:tyrosine-type recombinase/integrase [Kitasatospora sp. NPDC059463]|uniref:tyrosine-type recombinase/integrase n=1 Tax=unclassified Kitasatospora TaxID=2633591 RepID=UPI0036B4F20F
MTTQPNGRLEVLIFAHADGSPLRPSWVLDQLRKRTAELALPRIGLHDQRHTAASIVTAEGIPIAMMSKTLRHATLVTTINLYGHLFKDSADRAANTLTRARDQGQTGQLRALSRSDDMPLAA